jgi:hypothetical protein
MGKTRGIRSAGVRRINNRSESDDVRHRWRKQIERGWLQAQAGQLLDGPMAMSEIRTRVRALRKKRV